MEWMVYMDRKALREIQLIQLEMAKEVKRICENNHIKYFLDAGTLIGAVRHEGFIPWDDDLDIGMLREEYEKFIVIAPSELREIYVLQTWSDVGYALPFAKIRKKNTIYKEINSKDTVGDCGIFIDIFPFDMYPKQKRERLIQGMYMEFWKKVLLMKDGYTPWLGTDNFVKRDIKKLIYKFIHLITISIPKKEIIKQYKEVAMRYNEYKGLDTYNQASDGRYGNWLVSKEWLSDTCELSFEGELFLCPCEYHQYLTKIYGDYMRLPPENEREDRHGIIEVRY